MPNKSYRIRTKVGEEPGVLNIRLDQSYDLFEVLSLKLTQEDAYKLYSSPYGVIVGRIIANGGFGIPNAKVSVFIEVTDEDYINNSKNYLYPYFSTSSVNNDGIRYNLLPDEPINDCYQNVGTFPNKRLVLDNETVLEIYDTYWKYTSVTNEAGDYMIFGVPTGQQQIHVDIDLSDIGVLSQRPRDMIYKGYNINQFESPNKFKQSTNLDSLPQIYTQNLGVNVYPFWGDSEESDGNVAITRADIQIEYLFEPTCVFMGSIISDTGTNAIGKNCTPMSGAGKMDQLRSGEGSIEMIRKNLNGTTEEYQIKGSRLIDGDGVWCYQIPMNLDYVTTDEYGNIVQTDIPTKGIPTRTRVRFRISLDESPNDATARKTCKLLVPNNPRDDVNNPVFSKDVNKNVDYEFGTSTREESYRDLLWNKVYSVKSYIPRLQNTPSIKSRKHSGIKMINHYGSNNPIPYNNVSIKLGFMFRMICVIAKIVIMIITIVNGIISVIGLLPCAVCKILRGIGKVPIIGWVFKQLAKPFCAATPTCIPLTSDFCDDDINKITYYPGCFACSWDLTKEKHEESNRNDPDSATQYSTNADKLYTCVENELAQDNDVTSFNFFNDWVNGMLYAPLWFRKITPKKRFLFGLIKIKAKDQWCNSITNFSSQRIFQPCSLWYKKDINSAPSYKNNEGVSITPYCDVSDNKKCNDNKCHEIVTSLSSKSGVIVSETTMLKQTVYYYSPIYYDFPSKTLQLLYATDIILLGSLSDCDLDGVPQFFRYLESSTYNMPSDILFTDTEITVTPDGTKFDTDTEMTGADWGNHNSKDQCNKTDGGLFYGIGCSSIEVHTKSCVNLQRICELGVSLDETIHIRDISNSNETDSAYSLLVADGFVSKDELSNNDARSMFATLNGNNLMTKLDNTNGLIKYDFNYIYPNNFDGSLNKIMTDRQSKCGSNISYRYNYKLEQFSVDYYKFRMGNNPFFYKVEGNSAIFPRFENSFYFYFGLNNGKTATEKFNSQFFSTCANVYSEPFNVGFTAIASAWCDNKSGTILLNSSDISTPYEILINGISDGSFSRIYKDITLNKVYVGKKVEGNDDFLPILDDDGKNDGLPNGDYELTITDSDGSITQKEISLVPMYLTYNAEILNFKYPNNILTQIYGSFNNVRVAKLDGWNGDGKGWKNGVPGENSDNLGGRITISGVFVGAEQLSPVKNNGSLLNTSAKRGYTIKLIKLVEETKVNPDTGESQTLIKNVIINLTEKEILSGIIECDEGGFNYQITIVELCKDSSNNFTLQSNNSVSKVILVDEPLPIKLFINDVDYEVIKNFKTGWVKDGNKWVQRQSDFYGWDKISDIDNPAYNWGSDILDLSADLQIKEKEKIVNLVKSAFWVTCESAFKTLIINAQTNNFPVTYAMQFQAEIVGEDVLKPSIDSALTITTANTVNDIQIPTLLSKDAVNSGQIVANYGKLNSDKCPYFVVMRDNEGIIIPVNANVNMNAIDNSDTSKWFGVHLIDKILKLDMTMWAGVQQPIYFENLPYGDNDMWKKIVSDGFYSGFLRGIINNGIAVNETVGSGYCRKWYRSIFDSITLSNKPVTVETITFKPDGTPDENALPTKRRIVNGNNSNDPLLPFKFPCSQADNDLTAVEVSLTQTELDISDSSNCGLNQTIYGSMSINLKNSLNNCAIDALSNISVSISNGDSSNNMTYVMITSYNQVFKYPNHEYNLISGNSAIYASGVTQEDIINQGRNDAIATSTIFGDDEEGNVVVTPTTGYGETGIFEGITGTPTVYIVGMTQNNCRAISPVYDFRKVTASITLEMKEELINVETTGATGDTVTPTGTTGDTGGDVPEPPLPPDPGAVKVKKYYFIVEINTCDQWYISKFESVIAITCNASENQPIGSTMTFTDGNIVKKQFKIEIDKGVFDSIMKRNINIITASTIPYIPKDVDKLINSTIVDITDKLGMITRCKLSYKNPNPIIQ